MEMRKYRENTGKVCWNVAVLDDFGCGPCPALAGSSLTNAVWQSCPEKEHASHPDRAKWSLLDYSVCKHVHVGVCVCM